MFGISPKYYLEDIEKQDSPIIKNPSPKIHRIVSKDVYTQEYGDSQERGDCAAFASARVLCKWIRTHNPQFFSGRNQCPHQNRDVSVILPNQIQLLALVHISPYNLR